MAADLLRMLLMGALASSASLLLVRLLRSPLRRAAGARAAYWLWLLVPAVTVAVLLPAPSQMLLPPTATLPAQIQSLLVVAVGESSPGRAAWITPALCAWAAGATGMLVAILLRQRAFLRSLGPLEADTRGMLRGPRVPAPMLIGAWRARIVLPADFESRYSPAEQELVLAHERAHARRGDVAINLLASLALCVFWFNPLAYRALAWLRTDQELACDAAVLAGRMASRRAYAGALLKTQLAAQSAWREPIGCRWQSTHPLKERILMIKRPLPGFARRLAGVGIALGLTTAAGYAAWAGQPPAPGKGPHILVDLKMTITNTQTNDVRVLATRYLVHSGETIKDESGQPLDFACTPFLADEPGRATDWSGIRARGIPVPPAGHILMTCSLRQDGNEVSSPAVMMADGKWGTIETAEKNGPRHYRLELNASTSAERIAEAAAQADK
jgi:beta-lactamase regulating signal transducer with metallopeptidase domain